ncbi:hypothetical protein N7457_003130 [Penicillium paradoxum]|uniref:uncharacterized protein n=1 Tax=Penicillium paradoxum TaxID=176176 RepID=UPI0025498182|nr:uncharacterized protein N7457_003130 [Penicillium paradoxum]KAJ5788140.1 hypothetical protein N7457_003130 [Penicillium paradoxum]
MGSRGEAQDFQRMTNRELEMGGGPSFAVFKYLCYSATDSSKKAFMRIYFQIPNPEQSPSSPGYDNNRQLHPVTIWSYKL